MICPTCGADNAEGAAFCYNCSNPLPQTGPQGWTTPPPAGPPVPPGPPTQPPSYPPAYPPGAAGQPPVKPPRRMNAGLAGLIAFVGVLGVGLLVFFVFIKGGGGPTPAPTTPVVTTTSPPPTTVVTTTTSPTTTSPGPSSPSPSPPQDNTPKMFAFVCSKISSGRCLDSSGDQLPAGKEFVRSRSEKRVVFLVGLLNVRAGVTVTADFLNLATGSPVTNSLSCTTNGSSPFECRFHLTASGGFPAVTLAVIFRVNGNVVNPDNAPGGLVVKFV